MPDSHSHAEGRGGAAHSPAPPNRSESGDRTATVVIASTRAATGVYEDRAGPLIARWLGERGFVVAGPVVVPDGPDFAAALNDAVGARVVITSGGTGISPTDRTPQATSALLDYEIPGLAEALRRQGVDAGVSSAVLSRGVVGVAGRTLVVNLPGSTGGVRDGLVVLDSVLDHALDQIAGGDHPRGGGSRPAREAVSAGSGAGGGFTAGAGSGRVAFSTVGEDVLDLVVHERAVSDRRAGAVVSFAGVVRDHDDGRSVTELEYHAHPSAPDVVAQVAADIASRRGVIAVAVSHRVGLLSIGDVALAAAVSAAHRGEAFAACSDLVDEVKHRLPVWKRQLFVDGTDEWVGSA